jgi:hypothetical protein
MRAQGLSWRTVLTNSPVLRIAVPTDVRSRASQSSSSGSSCGRPLALAGMIATGNSGAGSLCVATSHLTAGLRRMAITHAGIDPSSPGMPPGEPSRALLAIRAMQAPVRIEFPS